MAENRLTRLPNEPWLGYANEIGDRVTHGVHYNARRPLGSPPEPSEPQGVPFLSQENSENSALVSQQRKRQIARESRRRCDAKKNAKISNLKDRKKVLEPKIEKIRISNELKSEKWEKYITETDEIETEEAREILILEFKISKNDSLVEMRKREEANLKELEEDLLKCKSRFQANEDRKDAVPDSTYRPQLSRTKKDIERAKISIEVKNLEIELKVEERIESALH